MQISNNFLLVSKFKDEWLYEIQTDMITPLL